ncbi:MAG TPA: hypothetical protein VE993_06695 [Stellaceae bacterium]|nr:hypothetical protein [Stellaceae bacterium]
MLDKHVSADGTLSAHAAALESVRFGRRSSDTMFVSSRFAVRDDQPQKPERTQRPGFITLDGHRLSRLYRAATLT